MTGISQYYDEAWIAREVAEGRHREAVGGLWDEVGKLQLDFLRANGLSTSSRLLDIGCGCLRAGVHFVEALEPHRYFGLDISPELLRVGYEVELKGHGLCDKLPRDHLVCDAEFDFSKFGATTFDFAIAQSLFTHLPTNLIQLCLARAAPRMTPGASLYASFFIVPDEHPIGAPFDHPHGLRSFDHRDPYHYRFRQVRQFCSALPWSPRLIGAWGHPRDQQMVCFRTIASGLRDGPTQLSVLSTPTKPRAYQPALPIIVPMSAHRTAMTSCRRRSSRCCLRWACATITGCWTSVAVRCASAVC